MFTFLAFVKFYFLGELHKTMAYGPGSLLIIVMIEGRNINAYLAIFYLYSIGQEIFPDFRE